MRLLIRFDRFRKMEKSCFAQGQITLAANHSQLGNFKAASMILEREKAKKPGLDIMKLDSRISYREESRRAVLINGLQKTEKD